ncbi:hypothetical protein QPK87_06840 [Kamptonema cortianum]|nr:hypothetical protein [Geitlerinema splendidum]MDK3156289.1 hypothetical protein [Kamptonema cortianum]
MITKSIVFATLLAPAVLIPQDAVEIKWSPKVGETVNHQMNIAMSMDAGGTPMDINVSFVTVSKILSIDGDTVKTEDGMKDFKMMFNGQDAGDMGPDASAMNQKVITTRKLSGKVVSIEGGMSEMSGGPRVQQMNTFEYPSVPVKVGDSWMLDFPKDASKGLPLAAKAKFTYEGDEKIGKYDTWKIAFVYSEMDDPRGYGNMGTTWLDKSTGKLVKLVGEYQNVSFNEMMPPSNAKITINIVN